MVQSGQSVGKGGSVLGFFIEEGALWEAIINSYLLTIKWFMGAFDDHYCDPTLLWVIVGLKAKS